MENYKRAIEELEIYTTFFKKRSSAAEVYVDELLKLSVKLEELERKHENNDSASNSSSYRQTWKEVRSGLATEISIHRRFGRSSSDLLQTLLNHREEKERGLKLIRDQNKVATNQYSDYKTTVTRLKRTYFKRTEEAEEAEATAREELHKDDSVSDTTTLARRASVSNRTNIATVSTAVLKESASLMAEKAMRAIKGDKGDSRNDRIRKETVRLRRESEASDIEYRAGVHHLETLRIQQDRVAKAMLISLMDLCHDISSELKAVFAQHAEDILTLGKSLTAIGNHAQHSAGSIDPVRDATTSSSLVELAFPQPNVLYENYYVGECKSLIFGSSLSDALADGDTQVRVPRIVRSCIDEIERGAWNKEGIYRISPNQSALGELVRQIEKDESMFSFEPYRNEPALIAGVLKLYLRQLSSPLFPFPTSDRRRLSSEYEEDPTASLISLSRRLKRLPLINQSTLKLLMEHLRRVAERSAVNLMTPTNLAVCLSTAVFGEDHEATLENTLNKTGKDIVLELLITEPQIFDGVPFDSSDILSRSRTNSSAQPLFVANSLNRESRSLNRQSRSSSSGSPLAPRFPSPIRSPIYNQHATRDTNSPLPLPPPPDLLDVPSLSLLDVPALPQQESHTGSRLRQTSL